MKSFQQIITGEEEVGDKQFVKLQETPEMIPAGETPQTIQLYCFDELYDSMRPGDRVEVTGILRGAGFEQVASLHGGVLPLAQH